MVADRLEELCEAFLLSGLEGEELREFQEELDRRGEGGARTLQRTREALGLLALTAPPEAPPTALRERLMAEVRRESVPQGRGDAFAPLSARGVSGATSPDSTDSVSWQPRETYTATRVPSILLAAALVAIVVLGIWNGNLRSELAEQRAALASANEQISAVETLRGEVAQLREDMGTMVAPSASIISLAGTATRPEARARIYVDPETGRALVRVFELPVLEAGSVYQLWAIRDGQPFSVGTFMAREDGPARLDLDALDPVAGADALAVTIEPAPGQPAPTGEMVLISGD